MAVRRACRARCAGGAFEAAARGVPIGALDGLIGLGGGEFRIPVLLRRFQLDARAIVPVNATISLFALGASLLFRGATLSWRTLPQHAADIAALTAGGVIAAFFVADFLKRVSSHTLHQLIVGLLVVLGFVLIAEGIVPYAEPAALPDNVYLRALVGVVLGVAIGAVATLLGVAGGELLIPTLLFVYGLDIKTAGTASLVISLTVVATGLARFHFNGLAPERGTIRAIAMPMAAGSVLGALAGAYLAASADQNSLKVGLGFVLLAAAGISSRR